MGGSLEGKVFGRLKVLADNYINPDAGQPTRIKLKCICSCGNTCIVPKHHVKGGYVKSCGCLKKEQYGNMHVKRKDTLKRTIKENKEAFEAVQEMLKKSKFDKCFYFLHSSLGLTKRTIEKIAYLDIDNPDISINTYKKVMSYFEEEARSFLKSLNCDTNMEYFILRLVITLESPPCELKSMGIVNPVKPWNSGLYYKTWVAYFESRYKTILGI